MNEARVKELLRELLKELENAPAVDNETTAKAHQLEADIRDLVDPAIDTSDSTALDDAIALQANFAARHPVAENILREIVNSLGKMGI